ncbi:MAG: MaoC family dehydratase [Oscillospiraceae bacterium]|jgi:3-hydroxybutyryl-CoA dehydratase|nr:MaoC family dehydratase [Oscillospiraceae bacterium]
MKGKTIAELKVGDSAFVEKTIAEGDVYLYAGITGDLNPAHVNKVEAENGIFKRQVAHGMLTAGLISAVLGMYLPGPGTIYLGQNLKFTAPVYFGDTIRATATVTELREEKNICILSTICTNQDGKTVIEGAATVKPPKE